MCAPINKSIVVALCVFGALVLYPLFSCADDFHYVNILVGDRAADMGGAYTAISDNASGCFYNPAGIAFGQGSNLSASVNGFSRSNKKYQQAMTQENGVKVDWEQESSILLPNFFGTTYDTRLGTFGFSYAVPDSVQRRQNQTFNNIQTTVPNNYIGEYRLNIDDVDNLYFFGPSYAIKLSETVSLGSTIYMTYRDSTIIRNSFLTLNDSSSGAQTGFEWRNSYISLTEWGIKPVLGGVWSPREKVAIGLTLSKRFNFSTDRSVTNTINTNVGSDPHSPQLSMADTSADRDFPLEVKLGFAYFASPALLLSADLSYYNAAGDFRRDVQTIRYTDQTLSAARAESDDMSAVVNFSLGAEYYMNERYAVRGGVYTDFANTEKVKNDGLTANQPEHIDLYGATLSLTRYTRSTSTTLGVGYAYGNGDAQIVANSPKVQSVEVRNLQMFLSAAYNF
jgi:long-chain fatty acid transport protein